MTKLPPCLFLMMQINFFITACTGSDNDERQEQQDSIEEVNVERNGTHSSEEQSPPPPEERPKRRRRSKHSTNEEREIGEIENLQDSLNSSLLITWGRNGTRSRHARVPRLTKLIQHLRNSEEENNEVCMYISMINFLTVCAKVSLERLNLKVMRCIL